MLHAASRLSSVATQPNILASRHNVKQPAPRKPRKAHLQNGEGSLATTAGKPAKDQSFFPPAMARCCYRLVLTFLLLVSRRRQLIAFLLCMPLTIVVSPSRPLNVLRVPPCNDAGGAVVTMMTWSCTAAKSGMAFAARGVAAAPALASATAEDGTHACEEATCLRC